MNNMFPSEAIQVLENTPSRVVILDPPYYSLGAIILIVAICIGSVACFLLFRGGVLTFIGLPFIVMAVILTVFGSFLLTSSRLITLSRSEGVLRIERSKWGMKSLEATIALNQIRRAAVGNVHFSNFIVIVMQSGESFRLGEGSNRQGYYGAVDAINHFLGVGGQ